MFILKRLFLSQDSPSPTSRLSPLRPLVFLFISLTLFLSLFLSFSRFLSVLLEAVVQRMSGLQQYAVVTLTHCPLVCVPLALSLIVTRKIYKTQMSEFHVAQVA